MNDIEHVFNIASQTFPKQDISCLLIGGYAVNHYGYTRSTLDVDFMCLVSDISAIKKHMIAEGFSNVSEHENVVFFQKPEGALRVDFLKVDEQTLSKLKSRAQTVQIDGRELKLPSILDLVAMKLFALGNGAERRKEKDLPDIVHLIIEQNLDEERDIKPLCAEYANEAIYDEIVAALQVHRTC